MRKVFIAYLLSVLCLGNATAQSYKDSRYYNERTGQMDYSGGSKSRARLFKGSDTYIGFRIGPSFAHVSSDLESVNASTTRVGLTLGVVIGTRLTGNAPLYFESGLLYAGKGGKGSYGFDNDGRKGIMGDDVTYNLGYLELPFVFKYKYPINDHVKIEPFFGGFMALGMGGSIKDYTFKASRSSFSGNDDSYGSFDAGLRFGSGISYDMLYMELGYDLGLHNICHDSFETAHTGTLFWNFGVNF